MEDNEQLIENQNPQNNVDEQYATPQEKSDLAFLLYRDYLMLFISQFIMSLIVDYDKDIVLQHFRLGNNLIIYVSFLFGASLFLFGISILVRDLIIGILLMNTGLVLIYQTNNLLFMRVPSQREFIYLLTMHQIILTSILGTIQKFFYSHILYLELLTITLIYSSTITDNWLVGFVLCLTQFFTLTILYFFTYNLPYESYEQWIIFYRAQSIKIILPCIILQNVILLAILLFYKYEYDVDIGSIDYSSIQSA